MRMLSTFGAAALLAFGAADAGRAEQAAPIDHSAHMTMSAEAASAPSTEAFGQIASQMHQNMAIDYTGNTDADFVRGMIPHHQGAIEMAKVELQYGTDPEIRRLAEEIIAAQEAEIALMQAWLKAKGE